MDPDLLYRNIDFYTPYVRALDYLATDYLPLLHRTFFDAKDQKVMFDLFDKEKEAEHQTKKNALLKKIEEQITKALDESGIRRSPDEEYELLSRLKPVFIEQHYAYNATIRNWSKFGTCPKNEISSWQEDAAYYDSEMGTFLTNITDMKILIRYYSNRDGGGGGSGPVGILCNTIVSGYAKKHNEFHLIQNVGVEKGSDIPCDCFKEAIYSNLNKEQKKLALTDTFNCAYWAVATTLGQTATWDTEHKIAAHLEGRDSLVRLLKWLDKNPGNIKNTTGSPLEGCIEISTNYRSELTKILEIFKEAISISADNADELASKGMRPRVRSLSSPHKRNSLNSGLAHSSPIPKAEITNSLTVPKKISEKRTSSYEKREQGQKSSLSEEKKAIFLSYLLGDHNITKQASNYFQKLHLGLSLREKEIKARDRLRSVLETLAPTETASHAFEAQQHHKDLLLAQLPLWAEIFEKINLILEREMKNLEST